MNRTANTVPVETGRVFSTTAAGWPRDFLFAPLSTVHGVRGRLWLGLSALFGAAYAFPALRQAFDGRFVIQDDARLHAFWMARFEDPSLFPNDLIANYFQSVAPPGYAALYRVGAFLGVDPLDLSRLLPMALAILSAVLCFRLTLALFPVPVAAFLASVLLSQSLWLRDDLASATSRAFLYPLLLSLLLCLARASPPWSLVSLALLGGFYPQFIPIAVALVLLCLLRWDQFRGTRDLNPRALIRLLPTSRSHLLIGSGAVAVGALALAPFLLQSTGFGPMITAAEGRQMAEFALEGRTPYFVPNLVEFWLYRTRSGLLPSEWFENVLPPPSAVLAPLLPLLLLLRPRLPSRLAPRFAILPALLLLGMGMFAVAHLFLFRLYLPGRYTQIPLRLVAAIAAAVAIAIVLDAALRWAEARHPGARWATLATGGLVLAALAAYPLLLVQLGGSYPQTSYVRGGQSNLYAFLSNQPPDTLIASVDEEVNNIPTFARRSILSGKEYGIAFHHGYYDEFRRRTVDLIRAVYSVELLEVRSFIERYGVDYFLLDENALSPNYVARSQWLEQFEPETGVLSRLEGGAVPALSGFTDACAVLESGRLVLLDATCVLLTH